MGTFLSLRTKLRLRCSNPYLMAQRRRGGQSKLDLPPHGIGAAPIDYGAPRLKCLRMLRLREGHSGCPDGLIRPFECSSVGPGSSLSATAFLGRPPFLIANSDAKVGEPRVVSVYGVTVMPCVRAPARRLRRRGHRCRTRTRRTCLHPVRVPARLVPTRVAWGCTRYAAHMPPLP
jgi:hypothetical protein